MDNRLAFLYSSIGDIQATIRATDVKIGFLFVVIFTPATVFNLLASYVSNNFHKACLLDFSILLIIFLWMLSFISLFAAVGALSPPASHVKGIPGSGIYHGSNFYKLTLKDVFFNFSVKSEVTIDDVQKKLLGGDGFLELELVYELLKVSYIRDLKIRRFMFSLRCISGWIGIALALAIYSYHGGLIDAK